MAIYESGHAVELWSTKKRHIAASGEKRTSRRLLMCDSSLKNQTAVPS
jgi:hypothetical protein